MTEKFVGYVYDRERQYSLSYDFQDDIDVIFYWISEYMDDLHIRVNYRNVLLVWQKIAMPAILDKLDKVDEKELLLVLGGDNNES